MTRPGTAGLVVVLLAVALAACSAGAPTVASDPTATPPSIPTTPGAPLIASSPSPTPTATAEPSRTPSPGSTATRSVAEGARPTRTPTPGPTPRPEPPPEDGSGVSQIYIGGTSDRREVALTFDAGADRGYAEQILDTLADYGVVASFGITGHWAEENPDLVKRMVEEGHMIFNHTWNHRSLTGASTSDWDAGVTTTEGRQEELLSTEDLIRDLTGGYEVAPYFRPPYGDLDNSVLADVAAAGYWITVMWTCDSLGWNEASASEIIERCGADASPGDIILLHVGSDSLDAEALPGLIETLREQELKFVTVETLLVD